MGKHNVVGCCDLQLQGGAGGAQTIFDKEPSLARIDVFVGPFFGIPFLLREGLHHEGMQQDVLRQQQSASTDIWRSIPNNLSFETLEGKPKRAPEV